MSTAVAVRGVRGRTHSAVKLSPDRRLIQRQLVAIDKRWCLSAEIERDPDWHELYVGPRGTPVPTKTHMSRSSWFRPPPVGVYLAFVGALNAALIVGRLELHDSNPSAFAVIGSEFASASAVPAGYVVRSDTAADGQFYLRLALNPFTRADYEYGIRLDNPPYRQQRILYPLFGWVLSVGNPSAAPIALIAVNYVSICVLAWIGARLAMSLGRSPGWGLFLPLYPGFVVSLARDLTEPLAICFVGTALLALLSKRHVIASVLLCAAALTRETTILVPVCFLIRSSLGIFGRFRAGPTTVYVFAIPLVVFGLWQAYLWRQWGELPLVAGGQNLAAPLSGVLEFSHVLANLPSSLLAWLHLIELASWALIATTVVLSLRAARVGSPLLLAWVGYSLQALVLSHAVWQSDWHALRALVEWHLLSMLILMSVRSHLSMLPFIGMLPVWVVTALQGVAD